MAISEVGPGSPSAARVAASPVGQLARRSPLALDPVVVEGHGRSGDPLSMSPGTVVIDTAFVRLQPVVLETDILRAAAVSASASAASDWTSIPRMRGAGATSGGTPVLLDGVRLFNPFHVGGFLSAFNSEAIKRVTVLTGSGGDAQAIGSLSGAFRHSDPGRSAGPVQGGQLRGTGIDTLRGGGSDRGGDIVSGGRAATLH